MHVDQISGLSKVYRDSGVHVVCVTGSFQEEHCLLLLPMLQTLFAEPRRMFLGNERRILPVLLLL